MQDEAFPMRRLTNRRRLARSVLVFEAVWRALWPAWMVAGGLLCLMLLNLLPMLGGWVHAAILCAAAVAFIGLLARGLWRIRMPDAAAVDRRLERQSGLHHRPLSVTADEPAISDPLGKAMWEAHRERTLKAIRALRVGAPAPGLPARDRRGFRFALLLCIIAALAIANEDAPSRIAAALNPVLPVSAATPAIEVQAWITPPAYTGMAPIFLRANGPVAGIPAGSHLTVNVSGSEATPVLALGDHPIAFKSLDGGSFQAEDDLRRGGVLSVHSGGSRLGSWALTIVADQPPTAAWSANPGGRETEQRLRLPWDVSDDYGVTGLQAELHLQARPDAPPLIVPIPLPGGSPKAAHGTNQPDLTANPWAGLPVIARLIARDAANQTGTSAEAVVRLPERPFHNPIARALIAARKTLSLHPDDRTEALSILDGLMQTPEPFADDPGGFAVLGAIYYDLVRNRADQAIPESQTMMWQLALHLEEGQAAQSARALEAARQRARDALQQAQHQPNDANRQNLLKRLEELKQAIDRHVEALLKQLRDRNDILQPDQNALQLSNRDLDRLASEAEKAAREGRLDQAQQQMDQLERMLDRLRSAHLGSRNTENSRRQQARNQTSAVQEMIAREGALMDHAQQRGTPGRPGDPDTERQADSKVQEALRRALGELMQQFTDLTGEVSPNLGAAERAMRDAQTALNQGDDSSASASQQGAIAALQKGGREMSQALARQSGRQSGGEEAGGDDSGDGPEDGLGMMVSPDGSRDGRFGFGTLPGEPGRADSGNRDPLGRTGEGTSSATGDVQVPEDREHNRTQAINEELRRRDADRRRSQEERDYINRLLKQF